MEMDNAYDIVKMLASTFLGVTDRKSVPARI